MATEHKTETVMLSKNKVRYQLAENKKSLSDLLAKIGIAYQTWAQRGKDNTWPVARAKVMAEFIGCKVKDLQSDESLVEVRE